MNKKGAEKIISVYWFIILILVAGGIYGMVSTFYNHPFDVRSVEALAMINQVADCISEKGVINEGVLNETNGLVSKDFDDNFLEVCNLNFNVENEHNWDKDIQYYLHVTFYNVTQLQKPFSTISKGNEKWFSDCKEINAGDKFNIEEKCLERRFYSVTKDNQQILISILSVVRKTEENVKL